ncbi:hypothetical protein Q5762_03180 [Streptomyces sp. P9(2023)]|uniref:hypothetical protein n=1 Tax=Streptomyces sp. P9(2023) TaxID=3064394 RepID=UPI0028F45C42|nr:hypothetical protein [Streptomyces sp. P9(2023)]MDT9687364.1 hypothetical protein [Streptomyces sp. P9(2023)]
MADEWIYTDWVETASEDGTHRTETRLGVRIPSYEGHKFVTCALFRKAYVVKDGVPRQDRSQYDHVLLDSRFEKPNVRKLIRYEVVPATGGSVRRDSLGRDGVETFDGIMFRGTQGLDNGEYTFRIAEGATTTWTSETGPDITLPLPRHQLTVTVEGSAPPKITTAGWLNRSPRTGQAAGTSGSADDRAARRRDFDDNGAPMSDAEASYAFRGAGRDGIYSSDGHLRAWAEQEQMGRFGGERLSGWRERYYWEPATRIVRLWVSTVHESELLRTLRANPWVRIVREGPYGGSWVVAEGKVEISAPSRELGDEVGRELLVTARVSGRSEERVYREAVAGQAVVVRMHVTRLYGAHRPKAEHDEEEEPMYW